jgi:RNA polymerase sigma-70 factor, ECF subfamily
VDFIETAEGEESAIDRARRGDHEAFRALVEHHGRAVFRLAFRMTGSEVDGEDVAQETFLKAWKQIERFDGRATFGTWLHRICANCALDHIRARKRKQDVQFDPAVQMAEDAPSPERIAESSQVKAILGSALDELTAMERSAFVLRHYEGLGIKEISATLGVQQGAAKHTVFRAVQKLRRALQPVAASHRKDDPRAMTRE